MWMLGFVSRAGGLMAPFKSAIQELSARKRSKFLFFNDSGLAIVNARLRFRFRFAGIDELIQVVGKKKKEIRTNCEVPFSPELFANGIRIINCQQVFGYFDYRQPLFGFCGGELHSYQSYVGIQKVFWGRMFLFRPSG
jgi:hypothetical protein